MGHGPGRWAKRQNGVLSLQDKGGCNCLKRQARINGSRDAVGIDIGWDRGRREGFGKQGILREPNGNGRHFAYMQKADPADQGD